MKKIIASAIGLVLVGGVAVTTASAVESQFGGYWRTRAFALNNFGQPTDSTTQQYIVDTRTRLYYTAKFNDSFKFVNRFEIDNEWGDNTGGDVGADGHAIFEVKHSYADFTIGKVNSKIGIQGANIARGFLFSADFSGAVITADFGSVSVPFLYAFVSNEDAGGTTLLPGTKTAPATQAFGTNAPGTKYTFGGGDGDIHLLSLMPSIKINDNITVTPSVTYANVTQQDTYMWWAGPDVDVKYDAFSAWATLLHNGGQIDKAAAGTTSDLDIDAWLFAAGAEAGMFHGRGFFATGDSNDTDNDVDSFVLIGSGNGANGSSYYWAEVLGDGLIDYSVPDNSMGDKISNVWAINAGITLKPMDKLTLGFDAWYAQLDKKVVQTSGKYAGQREDELGIELDTTLSYELMENLNADFVFGYLFAGNAIGKNDVYETGLQLSLKF